MMNTQQQTHAEEDAVPYVENTATKVRMGGTKLAQFFSAENRGILYVELSKIGKKGHIHSRITDGNAVLGWWT